jgi:hypothetical protein
LGPAEGGDSQATTQDNEPVESDDVSSVAQPDHDHARTAAITRPTTKTTKQQKRRRRRREEEEEEELKA